MNRPDVPTVEAVEVLPGRRARVTVEGGHVFTLSHATPRAAFMPETAYGAALIMDWRDSAAPSYNVPASLTDALARYFNPPTVQGFHMEGNALTLICDHVGHEYRHTITTPAPCNTYNLEGKRVHPRGRPFFTLDPQGPGRESFQTSRHAWPYLAVMLSGEKRKPAPTKRPLPTLAGVEVLPDGAALFKLEGEGVITLHPDDDAACSGPDTGLK